MRRIGISTVCIILVVTIALGGIGFFCWTLTLRSCWKQDRMTLNVFFSGVRSAEMTYLDRSVRIDSDTVDFLQNKIIMNAATVPVRFGADVPAEDAIYLKLPRNSLIFSPVGEKGDVNIQWTLNGKQKGYTLNCVLPFRHLVTYFDNQLRKSQPSTNDGE